MPTHSTALSSEEKPEKITLASGTKKRGRPAKAKKPLPTVKLPPNPFQSEILELVSNQRTKSKKVDILHEYRNDALVSLLIWNFDDSVVSALPEGEVPFKPNDAPAGTEHTSLRQEVRHFHNFIQGGNDSLSKTRRENIFIQILETLLPAEAELLCLVKDHALGTRYNLTQAVVEEAYPDIQWGGRGGQRHRG